MSDFEVTYHPGANWNSVVENVSKWSRVLERETGLKNVPKKFYVRVWVVPGTCHVYVVLICL
jgi:hypothetical protein